MISISFANLLCIDIDEKDGCDKKTAAEVVEKYAESHGLTFRLLETDRGMHAYCTSRICDAAEQCFPNLVGGLVAIFYFPINIGLLIIPID